MRIRDIVLLGDVIDEVIFTRNDQEEWEIHFSIGAALHKVTKHHPVEEVRTWKSLDFAVASATEAFGRHFESITINLKGKS